jgi:hemolysin III
VNIEKTELKDQPTLRKAFKFTKVPEERFNTASHFIGGILTILGTLLLVIRSNGDRVNIMLSIIYGVSNATLFFASAFCHSQKLYEDHRNRWSTLDQVAIYLMIAGTYTPITVFYLTGGWRLGILLAQWIFAGIGIILKLIKNSSPRWIIAGIYLIQGWMLIPIAKILLQTISPFNFSLIISGGFFYTVGVIFYVSKKPILKPGVFGSHELWHIFVLLGALSFYIIVYRSL